MQFDGDEHNVGVPDYTRSLATTQQEVHTAIVAARTITGFLYSLQPTRHTIWVRKNTKLILNDVSDMKI